MAKASDNAGQSIITVKQAAEILGITPGAVYDLIHASKIGHYRIGNGRGSIRFRREDVKDYLESCFHAPRSADVPIRAKSRRKVPSLQGLGRLAHCVPSLYTKPHSSHSKSEQKGLDS